MYLSFGVGLRLSSDSVFTKSMDSSPTLHGHFDKTKKEMRSNLSFYIVAHSSCLQNYNSTHNMQHKYTVLS